MSVTTNDPDLRASRQGQAQFESIRRLVTNLNGSEDNDDARTAIHEDALSVRVRAGWYFPGQTSDQPEEFEILLCTGGPAVRLIGRLDQHAEPESVTMQVQDWFVPWTDFVPDEAPDCDEVLLAYARCFYFGQ